MSDNDPKYDDLPDFFEVTNSHGYPVGYCVECRKSICKAYVYKKFQYCIACLPRIISIEKAKNSLDNNIYTINCVNCGNQWKGTSQLVMCPQCEKINQFSVVSDRMGSICVIKDCGKIAHKGIRWVCDTHFENLYKDNQITIPAEDFRLRYQQYSYEKLLAYLKEKGVVIE